VECLSNVYVSGYFILGGYGLTVSAPLFGLGVALTALGAVMVLLSFKIDGDIEEGSTAILFIGPIPLVLSGRNRWLLVSVAVVSCLLVSLLVSGLVG